MTTIMQARVRPKTSDDYRAPSKPRTVGLGLALVGLTLASVAFIASLAAVSDEGIRAATLPWTFGLTTLGFGTIKLGIAVVLWGILIKLWLRVDAIKEVLAKLVDVDRAAPVQPGEARTQYGTVTITVKAPPTLAIHRMAKNMWNPMLVMGVMSVAVGFVISLAWAASGGIAALAWTQGLQFLGEGLLLSGISFLLGTILWAIRTGGGEVQEGLGVGVKTLKMPRPTKGFVALMMLGLMVSVAQFIGYLVVAGGGVNTAAWLAFLGPLRELGLGLILAGITLALAAIGNALGFQFSRVVELIKTGK